MMKKNIEELKVMYPVGITVVMDADMDDANGVKTGHYGTVTDIDDAGTIHVSWDTGSHLGIIPGIDKFHKVNDD